MGKQAWSEARALLSKFCESLFSLPSFSLRHGAHFHHHFIFQSICFGVTVKLYVMIRWDFVQYYLRVSYNYRDQHAADPFVT